MNDLEMTRAVDRALQPEFISKVINPMIEQELLFEDIFKRYTISELSFTYNRKLTNTTEDIMSGLQGKPGLLNEVGTLSEIDTSQIIQVHGNMTARGYKKTFAQSIYRTSTAMSVIDEAINSAAYGISYQQNQDIISTIVNNKNDVDEYKADIKWGEPDADPIDDILKIISSTIIPGSPCMLTDLYLNKEQYFFLLSYAQNKTNVPWTETPFKDTITLPSVNGVIIHNALEGMIEAGDYIGLYRKQPGIEIYQYIDPNIPSNGYINVNQYTEVPKPYNMVTEFFSEVGYAIVDPNSLYYAKDAL